MMAPVQRNPLSRLRRELGWTQAKLARVLGVDVGTVSRIERGLIEVDGVWTLALEMVRTRYGRKGAKR